MPPSELKRNQFLVDLLSLQQDGKEAISAPTNWTSTPPLLEVVTDLDRISAELAEKCLLGTDNKVARWHFLVGSPGNGKSAAVGRLVRSLLAKGCHIADEHGTDIRELGPTTVPYALDVREVDRPYCSLRIIQDASVVRNPYASNVDPSRDLLETLREAWVAGISLVVCTNRGVLEKAFRDTHTDPAYRALPWHRGVLRKLAEKDGGTGGPAEFPLLPFDSRKPAFESMVAEATYLDKRSLILRQSVILDRLIQRAVEPERWSACSGCDVAALCPFRANRDWLADEQGRATMITLLRRAEVLSSQVIVFREALALVSYLLAGCSRDYRDTDPCGWVHKLVARGDVFALGSRRVHMCLFAAHSPRGLDASEEIRSRQLDALRLLHSKMAADERFAPVARSLSAVIDDPPPSSDVGVIRLLGATGVFSEIDAINGPLPAAFSDDWDGNYERIGGLAGPLVAEIDRACLEAWKSFEDFAEGIASHEAEALHWSIRRWSSQFTLHLGAIAEGLALDAQDLDEFTELLELLWKEKSRRTFEDNRRLAKLNHDIMLLLNRSGTEGDENGTMIAENVSVTGSWVVEEMKPSVAPSDASGSLTIGVRFGRSSAMTALAPRMYLWLRQRARGTMDPRCIPPSLLSDAMDAKSRAVNSSPYAWEPNGIGLRIAGEDETFKVERFEGEANVDVEP